MRDRTRINLGEAADALRHFLENEVTMHQHLAEELTLRNRGLLDDYLSRHRSHWSRMLGRLREAGMDAPEALLGSLAVIGVGALISFSIAAKRRL